MSALESLALQALSTPAVDASDAMDVLVDALLETDVLRDERGLGPSGGRSEGWNALRRRAFEWARRRLVRPPSPLDRLAEIVAAVLVERGLPLAVVGVVRPSIIRVHFMSEVDPYALSSAREAVAACLPGALYVETTCRRGR